MQRKIDDHGNNGIEELECDMKKKTNIFLGGMRGRMHC